MVHNILCGRTQIFGGIDTLRKICNHPDLTTMGPPYDYGQPDALLPWQRSAKMVVLENLLRLWKGELLVLPLCMLRVATARHSSLS